MSKHLWVSSTALWLVSIAGRLAAQQPLPWRDPSPHFVQFVTVDDNVKQEVLDWGVRDGP